MKEPKKTDLLTITPKQQRILTTGLLITVALILIASVWLLARELELTDIHKLAEFIIGWGAWGPIIVIVLSVIAALTGVIPASPLTLLAGAIWGVFWGTIIMLVGTMIGATLSFLITRSSLFPWVDKMFRKHARIYTQINDKYVTRFIFLSRLIPFFVFELISYGAGLTRIGFWHYFWATLLGVIPMTIFLAWNGQAILAEGGLFFYSLTALALLLMFLFPWLVERYNPFNLKEKLLRKDDD